jgi:hypothetical protein
MFRPQEPHPVDDTIVIVMVVALIDHSLNAGVNETTLQFNTIQKTRSAVSNYERTTAEENRQAALAGYKKGERMGVINTSMYSLWFDRFTVGCHIRMSDDILPDIAMCIVLLLEIQRKLEEDLERCETLEDMRNVSLHVVFLIFGVCGGLRGEEVSLVSLDAMR